MKVLTARGQATRDKVVSGAREVFSARGFSATRMGDIADAAGVAHGTVYTYFDTKEDVLLAVLERPATAGSFIAFNTGTTPIDEAIAGFER